MDAAGVHGLSEAATDGLEEARNLCTAVVGGGAAGMIAELIGIKGAAVIAGRTAGAGPPEASAVDAGGADMLGGPSSGSSPSVVADSPEGILLPGTFPMEPGL